MMKGNRPHHTVTMAWLHIFTMQYGRKYSDVQLLGTSDGEFSGHLYECVAEKVDQEARRSPTGVGHAQPKVNLVRVRSDADGAQQ